MFEVGVAARFPATHRLEAGGVVAPEAHPHDYRVETVVRGASLSGDGMLLDLDRLSAALTDCLAELASTDLDTLPAFAGQPTTVERVADYIWGRVRDGLRAEPGIAALRVTVFESPDAWASVDRAL